MNYEIIKNNYKKGLWSEAMVTLAVSKGIITDSQKQEILNSK